MTYVSVKNTAIIKHLIKFNSQPEIKNYYSCYLLYMSLNNYILTFLCISLIGYMFKVFYYANQLPFNDMCDPVNPILV